MGPKSSIQTKSTLTFELILIRLVPTTFRVEVRASTSDDNNDNNNNDNNNNNNNDNDNDNDDDDDGFSYDDADDDDETLLVDKSDSDSSSSDNSFTNDEVITQKKKPAQTSSSTKASKTIATSNDPTIIKAFVKPGRYHSLQTKMEVLAFYDKFLEEHGPSHNIFARVAKNFTGISADNVRKWVRDRYSLSNSNIGKSWTKEECVKLRKLRMKHPGPNDWKKISSRIGRAPISCQTKYKELEQDDQCTSAEQFHNIPDELLDLLNAKLVDGANEYSTLTHVSYIGPESWVEMTDAMVEPFKERFTEDCNRVPSQTVAALIESSVDKQTLLPDTVVREEINFDAHKQCNLPHIRHPDTH